jgi:hypothetical protein
MSRRDSYSGNYRTALSRPVEGAIQEIAGSLSRVLLAGWRGVGLPQPSRLNARSCSMPSDTCCDPHLGHVTRDVHQGETVIIPVRFSNRTGKLRHFSVAASEPWRNAKGEKLSSPILSHDHMDLGDGEIGQITVTASVTQEFDVGTTYAARVFIRSEGSETQMLTVSIRVSCDEGTIFDLCCGTRTKQRPLQWQHHYYCDPVKKQNEQ